MRWISSLDHASDHETIGDVIQEAKDAMRDLCQDIADTDVDDRGPLLALLDQAGDLLEALLSSQKN